jgi:hypothetical protein
MKKKKVVHEALFFGRKRLQKKLFYSSKKEALLTKKAQRQVDYDVCQNYWSSVQNTTVNDSSRRILEDTP